MKSFEERFWGKVRKTEACWEWTGSRSDSGRSYGQIWRNGRLEMAHRVSWELHGRKLPEGTLVLHTCDNRACVNPGHLFLGDHRLNAIDKVAKGRHSCQTRPETVRRGRAINSAKLDEELVRRVRELSEQGLLQREIGEAVGVHQTTVGRILLGRRWKHVG